MGAIPIPSIIFEVSKERGGYGFSNEDKKWVREMSDGQSAFGDGEHNDVVHHIRGCYVGRLGGVPKETISDVFENAIMLSDEEAAKLDAQEDYERACLEYEIKGITIYEGKTYRSGVRNTRHHRRRRKHR